MPDGIDIDVINQALAALTSLEREVIKLRCGLADGYHYTVDEIGRILNMSAADTRRMGAAAVCKLQLRGPLGVPNGDVPVLEGLYLRKTASA